MSDTGRTDRYFTNNYIKKPEGVASKNGRSAIVTKLVSAFNHNEIKSHFYEPKRSVSDFDKSYKYPDNLIAYKIKSEKFSIELLTQRTDKSEKQEEIRDVIYNMSDTNLFGNKENSRVILQIHGGGYINAFKNHYRTMAKLYVQEAKMTDEETSDSKSPELKSVDVLSVDYRVAPKDLFPAALEDVIGAFDWLICNGYTEQNIIVAGDSAGGGLALGLCHYLRDKGRKMPAGIICMSPWTDLTLSGASYKENFEVDAVFGNLDDSIIYNNPYPGEEDLKNPYISPLFGDFTGFPPMLIQVGSEEMLLDDSRCLAKKARKAGVKVRLSEYDGMFHVFQMCGMVLDESKYAWQEIGKFINYTLH